MAAIDKTYVSSYEDYRKVIDWARTAEFVCPNGKKFSVIDYCYYTDKSEEEIREMLRKNREIPVMNTPVRLDYFLIKHCPIELVQERMKEVYDTGFYDAVKNGAKFNDLMSL